MSIAHFELSSSCTLWNNKVPSKDSPAFKHGETKGMTCNRHGIDLVNRFNNDVSVNVNPRNGICADKSMIR